MVVGLAVRSIRIGYRRAGQAFEDDSAAHGRDLGEAPGARGVAVGGGEEGVRVEDVESGKHRDDVAVVDAEGAVSMQPYQ